MPLPAIPSPTSPQLQHCHCSRWHMPERSIPLQQALPCATHTGSANQDDQKQPQYLNTTSLYVIRARQRSTTQFAPSAEPVTAQHTEPSSHRRMIPHRTWQPKLQNSWYAQSTDCKRNFMRACMQHSYTGAPLVKKHSASKCHSAGNFSRAASSAAAMLQRTHEHAQSNF